MRIPRRGTARTTWLRAEADHPNRSEADHGESMYDAIIVGGGPAGLSAALSLANFRRAVVALDAGEQRNLASHAIHNYLGLDGVAPAELLRRGREDAQRAGAELRQGRVTAIRGRADEFEVAVDGQPDLAARRIVLATSLIDVKPDIDNLDAFYGTSVHHCPICDGVTCIDRPVVVISWGPKAAGFVLELQHWTKRLTLVTHGHSLDPEQRTRLERYGVSVRTERAQRLDGRDGQVANVVLDNGEAIPCDAVFFNVAHRPRNELARGLGCALTAEGYVQVDEDYQTTVQGVYAAGDITSREESAVDAVAEGFIAATQVHLSLYPEL
jgi:thioredoxin reductase